MPPQQSVEQELMNPGVSDRAVLLYDLERTIKDHSLLTREQEQVLTFQVRDEKAICENLLFRSPRIIKRALEELRTLNVAEQEGERDASKSKRAYQVIMFETGKDKPTGGEAGAIARVTQNLKTVEKLVARLELLVTVLTDSAVSEANKEAARTEFDARRERIAALLTECRFRRAVFKRFEREFKEQVQEARVSGLSAVQHVSTFWESPAELSRRLNQVEKHSALYEQARRKLVSANLRLVLKEAGRWTHSSVSFQDLFQSGVTGLCTAIDLFDPDRGLKLSTYATNWIRQAVRLCANNSNDLIPKNSHIEMMCREVSGFITNFVAANGFEPSDQEIADQLDMARGVVIRIRELLAPVVSIQGSFTTRAAEDTPIAAIISAPENDVSGEIDRGVEALLLRRALQELPYRQRICIALRHNLLPPDEKVRLEQESGMRVGVDPSFRTIAKMFGVTTQRVHIVYRDGLAELTRRLLGVASVSREEVNLIIDRFAALSRATKGGD